MLLWLLWLLWLWVGDWRLVGQGLHHTSYTTPYITYSASTSFVLPFSLISNVILMMGFFVSSSSPYGCLELMQCILICSVLGRIPHESYQVDSFAAQGLRDEASGATIECSGQRLCRNGSVYFAQATSLVLRVCRSSFTAMYAVTQDESMSIATLLKR